MCLCCNSLKLHVCIGNLHSYMYKWIVDVRHSLFCEIKNVLHWFECMLSFSEYGKRWVLCIGHVNNQCRLHAGRDSANETPSSLQGWELGDSAGRAGHRGTHRGPGDIQWSPHAATLHQFPSRPQTCKLRRTTDSRVHVPIKLLLTIKINLLYMYLKMPRICY